MQVVAVAVEAHGPDLAICVKHQTVVSHAIRRVVDGVEIGNADEVRGEECGEIPARSVSTGCGIDRDDAFATGCKHRAAIELLGERHIGIGNFGIADLRQAVILSDLIESRVKITVLFFIGGGVSNAGGIGRCGHDLLAAGLLGQLLVIRDRLRVERAEPGLTVRIPDDGAEVMVDLLDRHGAGIRDTRVQNGGCLDGAGACADGLDDAVFHLGDGLIGACPGAVTVHDRPRLRGDLQRGAAALDEVEALLAQ